jgi:macrolide transport system ATP-binding/permease protein
MESVVLFLKKLGMLFGRKQFGSELDEEMAFHREQAEKDLIANGMTPQQAKIAAGREFGNATRLKEQSHEVIGFGFETVVQDLKFALRQLRKNPGFTATAVLILALGMGASVAIFAFVDAALIKPLPYPNPTRLMDVTESLALFPRGNLSYADYVDWKRMSNSFSSLDAYNEEGVGLQTPSGMEPAHGERVTAGFFRTLGIRPALGRDFRDGEDGVGAAPVVLLSYGAWQRRFGGRTDVVGETVNLSGVAHTIIGVLPEDFQFAFRGNGEFWEPLQPTRECEKRRSCHDLFGVGRLRDGVTPRMALANMKDIAHQLEVEYPDSNRGQGASVMPLSAAIVGDIKPILLVLLGGACLLLLISCVNVASLLLVRSESRRREIAVRGALGASRTRLARQFATEGTALAVAGCLLGLGIAGVGIQFLLRLISKDMLVGMPFLDGLGLNLHVLLFAGGLVLLAAFLASATPIIQLRKSTLRDGLTEGGRGSAGTLWRRVGANLVVIELATAMVLLAGAALLGKSLYQLLHENLGFDPDHLAAVSIELPEGLFPGDDKRVAFQRDLIQKAEQLPGVDSVGITTVLPVSCNCDTDWVRFVGRPYNGIHNEVNERETSTNLLSTLGARLKSGRFFTDADNEKSTKVVLINEAFARTYFPGEDPIGKKFGDTDLKPTSIREIVGVVGDIKDAGLDQDQWPAEYEPFNQSPDSYFFLVVRTKQNPDAILPTLTATVHHVSPNAGVDEPTTMAQVINDSNAAYLHRTAAYLVGGFAALALVLGIVGLYGVIAYSVSQRTREIGVRMALGAQKSAVYKLVLSEAGRLIGIGVALGLAGAVGAAMLMGKLLFGVQAWDAETLAGVAVVLGVSAMLASFIPARRAASVNPTEALRAE